MRVHPFPVFTVNMTKLLWFSLLLLVDFVSSEKEKGCDTLFIPALGRMAAIGDLYDARSESFIGTSVFQKDVPNYTTPDGPRSAIEIFNTDSSDIHFYHIEEESDKYDILSISASLRIEFPVVIGIVEITGAAAYANRETSGSKTKRSLLVSKIRTVKEKINFLDTSLMHQDIYYTDSVKHELATHVVASVYWGADSIFTCYYHEDQREKFNLIQGNLSLALTLFGTIKVKGSASVTFSDLDNDGNSNMRFTMDADLLPSEENLPIDFETGVDLMERLPELIQKTNGGRGVPVSYELYPISYLPDFKTGEAQKKLMKDMQKSIMKQVSQMLDELVKVKKELQDLNSLISVNRRFVRKKDREDVDILLEKVTINEVELRSNLSQMLGQVKDGALDVSNIVALIKMVDRGDGSPRTIRQQIFKWAPIETRIRNARELISNGSIYLGLGGSIDEAVVFSQKSVVLYLSDEAMLDEERFARNKAMFIRALEDNKQSVSQEFKFFVADCDLQPCAEVNTSTSYVKMFQSDFVIVDDFLVSREERDDCGVELKYLSIWKDVAFDVFGVKHYYKINSTTLNVTGTTLTYLT